MGPLIFYQKKWGGMKLSASLILMDAVKALGYQYMPRFIGQCPKGRYYFWVTEENLYRWSKRALILIW